MAPNLQPETLNLKREDTVVDSVVLGCLCTSGINSYTLNPKIPVFEATLLSVPLLLSSEFQV